MAIQWANKTGQGVENGSILGENFVMTLTERYSKKVYVTDHQRKICPFFDILDNIFGEKKSFRVPNLHCNIQHKKPNEHSDQSDGIDEEQNNRTVNVNDNCVDVQNYDEWDINVIFDENLIDNVEQQNVNEAELPEKESSEGESIQQNELIQDVNVQSGGDDMCVEITEDTIVPSNSRKRSHVDDHVNPVLFGDSMSLEEEDDMIREILDDDDNQTTAGATSRNKTTSEDRVSRFRKCLSTPQSTSGFKATDNRQDRNATTLIGDALTKRATVMEDRNSQEFEIRKQEIEFEREKFDFEKEMRRKEMDFSHRLQEQKLRQEGRLAELKLKYEFERR